MNLPAANLICQFTLETKDPTLTIGVAYQSDDHGGNYGGWILAPTSFGPDPVITGLWDSDGNVYFTLYQNDNLSGPNVVINSGSIPGSFEPYITAQGFLGLSCQIEETGKDPSTNTYNYKLVVTADKAPQNE